MRTLGPAGSLFIPNPRFRTSSPLATTPSSATSWLEVPEDLPAEADPGRSLRSKRAAPRGTGHAEFMKCFATGPAHLPQRHPCELGLGGSGEGTVLGQWGALAALLWSEQGGLAASLPPVGGKALTCPPSPQVYPIWLCPGSSCPASRAWCTPWETDPALRPHWCLRGATREAF